MSRKKTNKIEAEGQEVIQTNAPFKIVKGGYAKPLGNGFYLLGGKKHEQGGIDLDLKGDAKIWSSVPFLNGESPAEKVLKGENPNMVFARQESYKKRKGLNDDGTKKAKYGKDSAIKTETDKEVSKLNRAVYSSFDPTEPYPTIKEGIVRGAAAYAKSLTNPDKMLYTVTDSVADNMWRYRMGMSVNPKHFGEIFDDGSVSLPKSRENEIPTDTTFLKNRIAANEKLAKKYPLHLSNGMVNEKREIIDWALTVDRDALDKLRHTYKTGEPVVINEGAYNSRSLIDGGELQYPRYMPLNMLKDYTIQYMPTENSMKYRDTYNFDNGDMDFEPFVPGTPYKINGSIDLTKNNMKSNNKKTLGGSTGVIRVQANGQDRLMYIPSTGEKVKADRKKALFGLKTHDEEGNLTNWGINKNSIIEGGVSLLGNVGAGLASYFINRSMLKDLKTPEQPVAQRAAKLKTTININPELDTQRKALAQYRSDVAANTADSRVSLARMNTAGLTSAMGINKLYADKENRETALINQDRLNQQEVANANINAYNIWNQNKVSFENAVREKQSENAIGLVNNINSGLQDTITGVQKRRNFKNNLAMIALANPNVKPEMIQDMLNKMDNFTFRCGGKISKKFKK